MSHDNAGIWNFEISDEIFHVLDFLRMDTCSVLYYNGPGMCEVYNFQRLIFGNSQSPDRFTGNPKIVSLPTSSQEIVK